MLDLAQRAPVFFWVNLSILATTTTLRIAHRLQMQRFSVKRFRRLEQGLILTVLANASHWSLMLVWALLDPTLEPLRSAMLLILTGMIGAGTLALAFNTVIRILFPCILTLPGALIMALSDLPEQHIWAGLSLVMLVYILVSGRRRQLDYLAALRTAIELEKRTVELEHISFTDTVTQLNNRAYFDAHFDLEWKRACRQGYPLALLIIDLDHFKAINDRYGHPFGDRCLAAVGHCLNGTLSRTGDVIARIGGEEFALILINTDRDGAGHVAGRIGAAIGAIELYHDDQPVPVTASIGVAVARPQGPDCGTPASLLKAADDALYGAKKAGRNRWLLADEAAVACHTQL